MTDLFTPRGDKQQIEHGNKLSPKFDADGLIPAICQDATTGEVLMFAFMNAQSLEQTLKSGKAHYWSRSRQKLWLKGESSGEIQRIVEIKTDCDQDVLLLRVNVEGRGASCHTGKRSCFYRSLTNTDTHPIGLEDTGGPALFDPEKVYGE